MADPLLDLFTTVDFDQWSLSEALDATHGFRSDHAARSTLKGSAMGIALDFISHKYKNVDRHTEIEGIRPGEPSGHRGHEAQRHHPQRDKG